jgi:hypothetical protein
LHHDVPPKAEIWRSREQGAGSVFDGSLPELSGQLAQDFGPDHIWSASRLETYQRCRYFFYAQNVLNLEARPEPAEGLDVTQLGFQRLGNVPTDLERFVQRIGPRTMNCDRSSPSTKTMMRGVTPRVCSMP